MKRLVILLMALSLTAAAHANVNIRTNQASTGIMVGSYADGIGGIFSYSIPIQADGLRRSGLGLMIDAELGGGIGDDFVMAGDLGLNLMFFLNNATSIYAGLGLGTQLLPGSDFGPSGEIGINFRLDSARLFVEAGQHPGQNNYLGIGMRF
ncbi:MAG: hypothetical protein JXQ97_13025 [Natronospirillum sp.]